MAKLPQLPFAVFDEKGHGADDRVSDYGYHCMEQGAWAADASKRVIGYIKPADVRFLSACNGQSVWVESAFTCDKDQAERDGLWPIYADAALAGKVPP